MRLFLVAVLCCLSGNVWAACADVDTVTDANGLVVSFADARTATASVLEAADGRLVYDAANKLLKYCNGSQWVTLMADNGFTPNNNVTGSVTVTGGFANPYMRLGFYRYAYVGVTANPKRWLHLKTNQPGISGHMQMIEFKGYQYWGPPKSIDARVSYYTWSGAPELYNVAIEGTHNLVAYKTSDNYVAFAIEVQEYFVGFILNQYAANPTGMFPVEITQTLWTADSNPAF